MSDIERAISLLKFYKFDEHKGIDSLDKTIELIKKEKARQDGNPNRANK